MIAIDQNRKCIRISVVVPSVMQVDTALVAAWSSSSVTMSKAKGVA